MNFRSLLQKNRHLFYGITFDTKSFQSYLGDTQDKLDYIISE